jgi:hypothetical protein
MHTYDVVGASELMGGRSRMGTNGLVIHQPSTGGLTDDVKAWLDKESIKGVKNKYLVAGLAAAGLVWYGYKHRWF